MRDQIPLIVLFIVYMLASQWERHQILERGHKERRALEDRLIAMTDRDASVLVHSQEQISFEGDVRYVDEAAELEIQGLD